MALLCQDKGGPLRSQTLLIKGLDPEARPVKQTGCDILNGVHMEWWVPEPKPLPEHGLPTFKEQARTEDGA